MEVEVEVEVEDSFSKAQSKLLYLDWKYWWVTKYNLIPQILRN